MRKMLARGFTLVELLIVIGLLGAIALIVIAAINPIEQANRARDARMKSDGGQILSAIERYFAARSEFPWVTGSTLDNEDAFGFITASDSTMGLCGASCAAGGVLVTSYELKDEFLNRDFLKTTADTLAEQLRVGKALGASASVYACYVPMAESNRDKACEDGKVYTISATNGTRTTQTCTADEDWSTDSWVVCIPE